MLALSFFYNSKWKKIFLVLGFLFHFSIFLIHGLFGFMFTMLGGLLLFCSDSIKLKNGKTIFD
jgi:hypothetical protein